MSICFNFGMVLGKAELVQTLLDRGVNVAARDWEGSTARDYITIYNVGEGDTLRQVIKLLFLNIQIGKTRARIEWLYILFPIFMYKCWCNRLKCPLFRLSTLQCHNMGHNGHEINMYRCSYDPYGQFKCRATFWQGDSQIFAMSGKCIFHYIHMAKKCLGYYIMHLTIAGDWQSRVGIGQWRSTLPAGDVLIGGIRSRAQHPGYKEKQIRQRNRWFEGVQGTD